ncbi:hypothetical protein [Burkholderia pseudomallei]|nr:hypothetical protein [Burkholderia pseudomallei]
MPRGEDIRGLRSRNLNTLHRYAAGPDRHAARLELCENNSRSGSMQSQSANRRIGESANSKRRSRQAGTKMKTTAIRSPAGSDDPPTRLSSPQQSFLAEVSRYGISHTTFELAPAMIPMPSFAVWRTVFMRDLAHAGLPDIAATHAIGEWVKLGTLEQRRTRDTARPLPVYRLPECFCTRSTLGLSASLQGAQHGFQDERRTSER